MVGNAIGEMLPSAIGIAISPIPVIAVVLVLVTPRASVNGPMFVLGWCLGIAIVGGVALSLASGLDASEDEEPASWVAWLQLLLGVLLLALALKQWKSRNAESDEPGWMAALDELPAWKALGLSALLASVNPKNLLLIIAGMSAIASQSLDTDEQIVALIIFIAIASIGMIAPVAIFFLLGSKSKEILDGLKEWMIRENSTIMAVLLLIIGVNILGKGIAGL